MKEKFLLTGVKEKFLLTGVKEKIVSLLLTGVKENIVSLLLIGVKEKFLLTGVKEKIVSLLLTGVREKIVSLLLTGVKEKIVSLLLTGLQEKSDHYWPSDSEPKFYGDLQVVVLNETHLPDWTITEFRMCLVCAWDGYSQIQLLVSFFIIKAGFVNTSCGKRTSTLC